jgi:hypothetical protein
VQPGAHTRKEPLELENRGTGRPRKEKDKIEPWQFTRASLAMCAYDEARGRDEKHSVAVADAVGFVKQRHPEMKISEAEVRRVLASLRPRNAGTILRVEQPIPTEQETEKWRWIRKRLAALNLTALRRRSHQRMVRPEALGYSKSALANGRVTAAIELNEELWLGWRLTMNHAAFRASSGRACTSNLTRRTIFVGATLGILFLLASCATKQAPGQHATILMRDGTTLTGIITASSPAEVTLAGDDNTTHTIPMTQVKSIEYDDTAAAQTSATQTGATPTRRASAARAASDSLHEHHYHPTRAEIHTKTYLLPVGTQISVRTEDTINSATAVEGQTYAGEIADDVLDANGDVVIPRGSNAQLVIRSASKGGRFHGTSDLVLDLQSISVEGQQYVISTSDVRESGKKGLGANKRTAEYTGGGAALGAIIGAIAGGGKGAAIGAGAGAGGGVLTQILTKGGSIRVPAETVLTFQLDKPVHIVEAK